MPNNSHHPIIIAAAHALWNRGRTTGKAFDELSHGMRADLIADSEAVIKSLYGHDKRLDRVLATVLRIDIFRE